MLNIERNSTKRYKSELSVVEEKLYSQERELYNEIISKNIFCFEHLFVKSSNDLIKKIKELKPYFLIVNELTNEIKTSVKYVGGLTINHFSENKDFQLIEMNMFHRNINNISSIIEIVDKEYENCKKIIRESGVCITEYDNISTIKLRTSSVGIELIILIINEILQKPL